MGSANALPSHGPGNEETSRKWGNPKGNPQEARRDLSEILGKPSSTQTANCKEVCDGVFKQNAENEPQQTLKSLFSCLGSSVKDT